MAALEQFLSSGRRMGKTGMAEGLALEAGQIDEGICLAVTAAYLVQATTLSGRMETPMTALENLEIKLPFIRSQLVEKQEKLKELVCQKMDYCMTKALGTLYQMLVGEEHTAAIDPHHAAQSAGYAGLAVGLRNVLSGSMVFNSAKPMQLAMIIWRDSSANAHPAACAKSGGVFYFFDCDWGVFTVPDKEFDAFIEDYHKQNNIAEATMGAVARI